MALIYTTIQHEYRKKNNLKIDEYTICDMVYHLSVKPDSDVPGWCYMSKNSMADELDLSRRTIINIINKLEKNGFLIRHELTKHLRTTAKWQIVYFKGGAKSAHPVQPSKKGGAKSAHGVQNLPDTCVNVAQDGSANIAHNNNTIDNNINNNILSEIKISDVPNDLLDYYKIALKFQELIIKNLEKRNSPAGIQKKAKFKKWVDPVRLMMLNDGVTKQNLIAAYNYLNSPTADFWQKNILSTTNLRKNISKVLAQAHKPIANETEHGKKTWMEKQTDEFNKGLEVLNKG